MANRLQIINTALSKLAVPPISNVLRPTNPTERLVALRYGMLRDAVIEEAPWSFALRRFALTRSLANDPAWGPEGAFTVPSSVVTVWWVYSDASTTEPVPSTHWSVEGDYIYMANYNTAYIKATVSVTDESKYDNLFVEALATRLAAELCLQLTENGQLEAKLWAEYAEKIDQAKAISTSRGTREKIQRGSLVTRRRM